MTPASVKARVTRATCSTVTPFCISASNRLEATSSPPVTAMQPARAISAQSAGVNVFSKRMFPHQVIETPRSSSRSETARSMAGGAASSTKWKPVSPVSATSGSMRSTIRSAAAAS